VHHQWLREHRKERDMCLISELGCLLNLLSAPLRASRVIPNTSWSTKFWLQSFAFRVFDIVSCHVPFCIRFSTIFVWFPGSQNLENRVLVEAKHEFPQNIILVESIAFHWNLTPKSLRFGHRNLVKIAEKCPHNVDCTNGLGEGHCNGESVPKMALGFQIPLSSTPSVLRAGATKTAIS